MLRWRSSWASIFSANLELAKQGEAVLGQQRVFQPIHITGVYPMKLTQLADA